jgi:hypothetical protein
MQNTSLSTKTAEFLSSLGVFFRVDPHDAQKYLYRHIVTGVVLAGIGGFILLLGNLVAFLNAQTISNDFPDAKKNSTSIQSALVWTFIIFLICVIIAGAILLRALAEMQVVISYLGSK